MSGETNLHVLLASMEPVLDQQPYGFCSVPKGKEQPSLAGLFACVNEAEGLTIIAPISILTGMSFETDQHWAKISLTIHSSLAAVGLTAAISAALAEKQISANIIAGYFHDHVFIQWERRHDAMQTLAQFKN